MRLPVQQGVDLETPEMEAEPQSTEVENQKNNGNLKESTMENLEGNWWDAKMDGRREKIAAKVMSPLQHWVHGEKDAGHLSAENRVSIQERSEKFQEVAQKDVPNTETERGFVIFEIEREQQSVRIEAPPQKEER